MHGSLNGYFLFGMEPRLQLDVKLGSIGFPGILTRFGTTDLLGNRHDTGNFQCLTGYAITDARHLLQ